MTSFSLLLWITLGICVQVALWLGVGFWRHWMEYRALRGALAEGAPVPAVPPATIHPAAAWAGLRAFRVAEKRFEDAAQSVCSFYLAPVDGLPLPAFLPGQFLTFQLAANPERAERAERAPLTRCYSISAGPDAARYRVSVKRVPGGAASAYLHEGVHVGDTVQVRAPGGHFYLDASDAPVVLIAGGIGITPLLAMLEVCLAQQPQREIWLFHGVKNSREVVFQDHLDALARAHPQFHLHWCFSEPLPADAVDTAVRGRSLQGRVSLDLLRLTLPFKAFHFYICGPGAMMTSLVAGLEDWGVPAARIHFEAFGPASVKRAQPAVAERSDIEVSFALSGKKFAWSPAAGSLLEFAESHGIAMNSGCRAGGCGTCQTRLQAGEVGYIQTPDFDPEPGACLPCVCAPKTSVTLAA